MAKLIDIIMPESDEGTESFVERWFKNVGDRVTQHEPILEINTDKVTMEIAAPSSGVLQEILKASNMPVMPGEVLGRIETKIKIKNTTKATAVEREKGEKKKEKKERSSGDVNEMAQRLSPVVRRMLAAHHLDAAPISGTGRGGRVTAKDVEKFIAKQQTAVPVAAGQIPSRMVPHNALRRSTARHMVESMLNIAPHVTAVFDADLSAIIAHRAKNRTDIERRGIKLTFTAYFIDATVKALQAVPEVNSRWHDDALEIFDDFNIGIAAATDAGLIVPVIHRAQTLSLFGIAENLQALTQKARHGKLNKSDVQNGTFTITNHGMTGSLIATPIINQPQSAILGIGKIEKRVIVVEKNGNDETEIKPMAYVTLTIDHRALDGFQANQFLSRFVEALQEWK